MDQRLINEQVAQATGETIEAIDQRGFILLTRKPVELECPSATIHCNCTAGRCFKPIRSYPDTQEICDHD